jgi:ABC-type sugar transport system substrate-binding protein
VAVGASAGERAALRSGKVTVLVAPRPAELGRRAVEFAAASAARQPERMPRTVQLDDVVLTRADLGTEKERQAAYPP